ncbi:MAG: DUF503 domain-containing protein [Chloroflexi bacterium]|nr:DUF503 domain-containing protein [Chloroflexota bacterium]MQC26980.1 DUF503 domain-containing protein [Chloroflexota bacterium]
MKIGLLTLSVRFEGSNSLKAKRGRIKPFITRLKKEFNVSVAEVAQQDMWQAATIACALVSNDSDHAQRSLQTIVEWIERSWPDANLIDEQIEIIS